jgi:hypothetical protein
MLKKEIYYLLLIKILLVQEELHGEHLAPSKEKKNKKVPKIYHYSEATKLKFKENSTNTVMTSLTLSIANSSKKPPMLNPRCSTIK